MKATGQMGGLTREQIELWRSTALDIRLDQLPLQDFRTVIVNLCDLALALESVRSEALEAALLAILHTYDEGGVPLGRAFEMANAALKRDPNIALSPARVAEEKDVDENELRK